MLLRIYVIKYKIDNQFWKRLSVWMWFPYKIMIPLISIDLVVWLINWKVSKIDEHKTQILEFKNKILLSILSKVNIFIVLIIIRWYLNKKQEKKHKNNKLVLNNFKKLKNDKYLITKDYDMSQNWSWFIRINKTIKIIQIIKST